MGSPRAEEVGVFGYDSTNGWWFSWFGAMLFLVVLAYAVHRHRLKSRRRRSLRREDDGFYVWVEIDGSPGRSRDDPRDRWDAEDAADGDGDGGGD
jgi:hypothetical protein